MATKKQNRRWKVRLLRRALNRSATPVRGVSAKRVYGGRHGDGIMGRLADRLMGRFDTRE